MPDKIEEKPLQVEQAEQKEPELELTDLPGIGEATAKRLISAGYVDLMSIAVLSPRALSQMAELTESTARKAILAARKGLDLGFTDANQFLEKRKEVLRITTGSKNLDGLLGGGVETKSITEAFGAFGSGKTQVAHSLACSVQLPKTKSGAEGMAVYIDTEATFRPERIKQLAKGYGMNPEEALKKILVARAFSSDHQMLLAEKVSDLINGGNPIKLVIVDSIMNLFRSEFVGRGMLADRQQKLNQHLHQLQKLADSYNLAIYITNQVMSRPDMLFGDPTAAVGGNIIGHACLTSDTLIQLSDGRIRAIVDLNKNNSLMAANFSRMKLEAAENDARFVNPTINKVYEIKAGSTIEASPLHRFFLVEDFSVKEEEARNLKNGDFVLMARKLEIEGEEQKLPAITVKTVKKISKEGQKVIKEKLRENNVTRKEVCKKIGITPRQFRRVLNQEYPTYSPVIDSLQNYLGLHLVQHVALHETHKHRNIIMSEILVPQIAQILGYFLGDGNFEKSGLRFRDERLEVLENYRQLFKEMFNVEGGITKMGGKNCYTLNINSVAIKELFEKLFVDLFDYIGKSKEEHIAAFIKGFSDAEGYISKKRPRITLAQKDKEILKRIQLLLLRLGVRSHLRLDVGKKKHTHLDIRDRDVFDYTRIGFTATDKQKLLEGWVNYCSNTYTKEMTPVKRKELWHLLKDAGLVPSKIIKHRPESYQYVNVRELRAAVNTLMRTEIKDMQIKRKMEFLISLLNGDLRFEKIRSIREKANSEPLFDLSVPKNENYIANGFIVHNSTYRLYFRKGKKDSRVAKLIDSPNMPDAECLFFLREAGLSDKE
ncbi:MAG TPA: DNA repair and recombination protein RadA [Nanoarchaeota archaeon]|nr:MAG: DNA repair protein RadA [archaeon GW2011_AR6]MBS3082567.1 DNA repair and recombination protein RadA [Candidatus Pacearchaeota archaeon]HIH17472.1 DNA repair and recombination protein RadA [Nanoarchaeota archaeon]HIH33945.1 DNA repair and recombination protein RadA [Nanoarchaeota archaeon]HIH51764.1 DNA repair and recombination protein RadA [Nanoarchaeota archaeon]